MSKLRQKIFNKTQEPVIYLRYINGVVSYIEKQKIGKKEDLLEMVDLLIKR
jgi:hypothetical protein